MDRKKCTKCCESKPLECFTRGHTRCKLCRTADNLAAYHRNPERVKQQARQWYRDNPDREYFVRRVRIEMKKP